MFSLVMRTAVRFLQKKKKKTDRVSTLPLSYLKPRFETSEVVHNDCGLRFKFTKTRYTGLGSDIRFPE